LFICLLAFTYNVAKAKVNQMTNEAIIDHDKNLLWEHSQAVKNLTHARGKAIRLCQLAEDFYKWLSTYGDSSINVKAEHKRLDEAVRSKAQTYKDIFAMALEAMDEMGRYEKEVADLAKKKAAIGLP
jgi:hypothetical protein